MYRLRAVNQQLWLKNLGKEVKLCFEWLLRKLYQTPFNYMYKIRFLLLKQELTFSRILLLLDGSRILVDHLLAAERDVLSFVILIHGAKKI